MSFVVLMRENIISAAGKNNFLIRVISSIFIKDSLSDGISLDPRSLIEVNNCLYSIIVSYTFQREVLIRKSRRAQFIFFAIYIFLCLETQLF